VTSDEVKKRLSKFINIHHAQEDSKMKELAEDLHSYFKMNSDTCLLNSNKIAAPSNTRTAAHRKKILNLILKSVPLSRDLTSTLGSPLSNETRSQIVEGCQERRNEILRHVDSHCYHSILKPFHQLEILESSLGLDFTKEMLHECRSYISTHLQILLNIADNHFKTKQYHHLREILCHCSDAQCLDKILNVSSSLQSLKLALNQQVIKSSEFLLEKGQTQ
jgi:hypothetical protein